MTTLAQKVVAKAASQIGVKESPANSNMQKYGKWFGMNGEPWCAIFVTWVFSKAKASAYFYGGKKVAYCPYVVTWAKKAGVWKGRDYKPVPGDVILFANKPHQSDNREACHIGIVEKRISAEKVQTIEGNTSAGNNANGGQVQRRTRTYGQVGSSWYILGFVHPKWPSEGGKATKAKAQKYTRYIVTAEHGLNFRAEPSAKATVKRTLPNGTIVKVVAVRDGWAKTKKGDWAKTDWLKKI